MGYWKDIMMKGQSPRYCFSSEEYKEAQRERERDSYSRKYKDNDNDDIEEKLIPDWFFSNLSYCGVCERYTDFINNVCSSHKVCVICENVCIDCWFGKPVCSRECYVKYKTISCFDCQNMFFKSGFSQRCSQCCDSIEQKLQKFNLEELKKLAKKYEIKRRKKEYIISDLLRLNHPIL